MKNNYTVEKNIINKNNNNFSSLHLCGSPTSNCQISGIFNINSIYVLTVPQIKTILKNTINYSANQLLITITDKRSIKKFNKFLEFYNIQSKITLKNEKCHSYLLLKIDLLR